MDKNLDRLLAAEEAGHFEQVHGRGDFQFPQLEMVRPDLEGLPDLRLPPGYSLRHYRPGDEEVWGEIMSEAFTPFWNGDRFNRLLLPHFGFQPERVAFVCWNGHPIGSACAFQWPGIGRECGYLHMVGVKKKHCGKALGYWLTVACLHRFREQGFKKALLQTEDFRIPAIKHYLRLGFGPRLVQDGQRAQWIRILCQIGGHGLVDEMKIRDLPTMSRVNFWWRVMLVSNYMSWLNLKGDLRRAGH